MDGTYANDGLVLKLASSGHMYTYMSEYTGDTSLRPQLVIDYVAVPTTPIEAFGNYETMGITAATPSGYTAADISEVRVYMDVSGAWVRQQDAVQVASEERIQNPRRGLFGDGFD